MKTKLSVVFFLLGLLFLCSCEKENIDNPIVDPDDIDASVVSCTMTADIERDSSGYLIAIAIDGLAPFTYSWSSGATEQMVMPQSTDDFTVTITDAEGCTATYSVLADGIDDCDDLRLDLLHIDSMGIYLLADVEGGTLPYLYEWSNGETGVEIPIEEDGEYSVTVTDAEGCVVSASMNVTLNSGDPCLDMSAYIMLDSLTAYALTAIVNGGTPPYAYQWSTGSFEQRIEISEVGIYEVTIVDAEGCSVTSSVNIKESDLCNSLGIIFTQNEAGTELEGRATGGNPPYAFSWSTGSNEAIIGVNVGETYTLEVVDYIGCIVINSYTVQ